MSRTTAISLLIGLTTPAFASDLSVLLEREDVAHLNSQSLPAYFRPLIDLENHSRDRCSPAFLASDRSTLPVVGSFVGTTHHEPCDTPQAVVMMKFQVASKQPDADARALRDELAVALGTPCADGIEDGAATTHWSDPARVVTVAAASDQGKGYTVVVFSRAALTPPLGEADRRAHAFWEKTYPDECRIPLD